MMSVDSFLLRISRNPLASYVLLCSILVFWLNVVLPLLLNELSLTLIVYDVSDFMA